MNVFKRMAKQEIEFLYDLERVLIDRKKDLPKGSYSTRLFKKGIDKIAQKLGEEAIETIIASKNKKDSEVIYESADLIYHLMVLLVERNIPLDSVFQELIVRSKK
ncbi:phosphoribosyl-ATP diphosphatase [Rhodohalobacter barkolensis]|uniref:Phosphoribosyl-ATP pyrophosphatase n=2 Tax=Rhodohalobacter barkolensis TaxID=2053187 RepID=A0A2N0VHC6_9BACT|nr:phosphoribosyl-ATP diphosphatase [Rhodohalobacter barkolensis]